MKYTFNIKKFADKKHSIQFAPATEEDRKQCSSLYLMRPNSEQLKGTIKVTIEDELETL